MIRSVNTGAKLWVPSGAVPMLTDSARNASCVHGVPLAGPGGDSSVVDVIAAALLSGRVSMAEVEIVHAEDCPHNGQH